VQRRAQTPLLCAVLASAHASASVCSHVAQTALQRRICTEECRQGVFGALIRAQSTTRTPHEQPITPAGGGRRVRQNVWSSLVRSAICILFILSIVWALTSMATAKTQQQLAFLAHSFNTITDPHGDGRLSVKWRVDPQDLCFALVSRRMASLRQNPARNLLSKRNWTCPQKSRRSC